MTNCNNWQQSTENSKLRDTPYYTITSYFEPALCRREEDIAHPAFSELFLHTEILKEDNAVIVRRNGGFGPALIHAAAGDARKIETSRFNYYGRGPAGPKEGFTIAPCVSIECAAPLTGGTAEAYFLTGASDPEEGAAEKTADLFASPGFAKNVFASAAASVNAVSATDGKTGGDGLCSALLYKLLDDKLDPNELKKLAGRELNVQGLRRLGLDLRFPTVLFKAGGLSDCDRLRAVSGAVKTLRACLDFNFCVLYSEPADYLAPLRRAIIDAAGPRALSVNAAVEFPETVSALEAISILI